MSDFSWRTCCVCGDEYPTERFNLGYRTCMPCGESSAREARKSWTVVQEYGKGPYQFIPQASVHQTLRETNQKQPRS